MGGQFEVYSPFDNHFRKGSRMWNIVIGIVFIVGGLSGKLALRGTESGPALAVLGGVLVIWGGVQMIRGRNNTGNS
jgi:hypothetical protein